jgi:hypothetical protein
MGMKDYDHRAEVGWKTFYGQDPAFNHGEAPTAKVISFFCKRRSDEPEVVLTYTPPESIDFDKIVDLKWARERLNKTLQYKKKWFGDDDIYKFVVLQNYLDECFQGNFNKCLLSWQELYMISPKVKTKKETEGSIY